MIALAMWILPPLLSQIDPGSASFNSWGQLLTGIFGTGGLIYMIATKVMNWYGSVMTQQQAATATAQAAAATAQSDLIASFKTQIDELKADRAAHIQALQGLNGSIQANTTVLQHLAVAQDKMATVQQDHYEATRRGIRVLEGLESPRGTKL